MDNTQLPAEVQAKFNESFPSHVFSNGQRICINKFVSELVAKSEAKCDKYEMALKNIQTWCKESGLKQIAIGDKKGMAIYHSLHLAKEALSAGEGVKEWLPIETAPKDGSTIEVAHDKEGKETSFAFWSDRPVCMLGDRNGGFPPGWATSPEQNTDTNLPLSDVFMWRPCDA